MATSIEIDMKVMADLAAKVCENHWIIILCDVEDSRLAQVLIGASVTSEHHVQEALALALNVTQNNRITLPGQAVQ